jgi:hypothetical protein
MWKPEFPNTRSANARADAKMLDSRTSGFPRVDAPSQASGAIFWLSTLPIRLEDLRLVRHRRSIWKKLFIDGVIVPHYVTGARSINHPHAPGNQLDGGGGERYRRGS